MKKSHIKKNSLISRKIEDFYLSSPEEERLELGLGPLEFERNKALILNKLGANRKKIVDVGGGTGKYSEWLAGLGHEVWMVEPIEKHIELAKKRAANAGSRFFVIQGEARMLELQDNLADMVILHGPLYHLTEREDRIAAINEALRITRPGGVVIGWAISYTASTMVALMQGLIQNDDVFQMCSEELTSGQHQAPPSLPGILAEAFYHRPEELKEEFETCGLKDTVIHAIEGITWFDRDYFSSRSDIRKKGRQDEFYRLTEQDPNLLALSPHFAAAGRKEILY